MKKEKLDIVYEDKFIIAVNKPNNLLTISTDNEKEKTLFHQVLLYERQKNKSNKVFIIHRLDKDTSGIVVFAKSVEVKNFMQDNWNSFTREYTAVVNGKVKDQKGSIKSFLYETKDLRVFSSNDSKKGKLAITDYELLKYANTYSLLKINILTGRKNQIRVQLNDIGHQIVGDKKYGNNKRNPIGRLALHANKIVMEHPKTHCELVLESKVPKEFYNLTKVSND